MTSVSEADRVWYRDNRFAIVKGGAASSRDTGPDKVPPPFIFFFCPVGKCPNSVEVASRHIDEHFAIACHNTAHRPTIMKRGGE